MLFRIFLGVLGDELGVVEVVDLHGCTNFVESLGCLGASNFATLAEDFIYLRDVLLVVRSLLTHRLEEVLHDVEEELLACAVSETSTTVMILHLVEVLILRKELLEVAVLTECIKICKHHIALNVTWISDLEVLWVSVHAVYLLLDLL